MLLRAVAHERAERGRNTALRGLPAALADRLHDGLGPVGLAGDIGFEHLGEVAVVVALEVGAGGGEKAAAALLLDPPLPCAGLEDFARALGGGIGAIGASRLA